MKISIVTPNYNYGRFLKKNLQSVLAQVESGLDRSGASSLSGHTNDAGRAECDPGSFRVEHIVIDGGSTDDSVSILKDWAAFVAAQSAAKAGRYTFSFVTEPDNGQTDAINKGLRRATGDIVAWLNADEWYLPGKLALVAAAFAKHPRTDFLYGEPLFVDKDGNPIRVKWDHWFSKFVLLCHDCHISSCCSFWRRNLLDEDGLLDPSFKVAMDYDYWCRLASRGRRFRFLPHVVGAFVWHDGNVSKTFADLGRREVSSVKRKYNRGLFRAMMKSGSGISVLDCLAHQWRRFLVALRLLFVSRESNRLSLG